MRRRTFLALGAATLWPRVARAQPARALPRIGWLSVDSEPDPFIDGFREGLKQYGYVDGQHVILERRYGAGNLDVLRAAAAEMNKQKVAFIVAAGPAIRAVRGIQDTPVLFAISGDPMEAGLAESLARPGRNFTGITFLSLEVAAKRVQLLKEALPRLRTVAALSNVDHPGEGSERKATEAAAHAVGVTLAYVPFKTAAELDQGLRGVREAKPEAMLVFPEGVTIAHRTRIAEFAIAQRMPSMFGWSEYVDAGGLMSYGANVREAYVRLAEYADRMLRGARPAGLPIVQPTRFELVVNARTARALDVAMPSALLLRAARIIE
jgi:putative tryptophan/tyrosine transport system substrate-binding protein